MGFGSPRTVRAGTSENFADGPSGVFVGDEDFADALLLGATARSDVSSLKTEEFD
jgi:hypothetical protein